MRKQLLAIAKELGIGVKKLVVILGTGIVAIATSETTLNLARSAGNLLRSAVSRAGHASLAKAGDWFPRARKAIVVGLIGGFRQMKTHFNQNGSKSVQSIRNTLAPVGIASVIGSLVAAIFVPIAGAAMLIGTYVVFYKDADSLPLTVFSTDAGVESALGIGTALIVNLFRLAGAVRAALRWVRSQF